MAEQNAAAGSKLRRWELAGAERRVRHELAEDEWVGPPPARGVAVLAVAAVLFAIVFAARVVVDDPSALLANFYAVPIALLAAEFGIRGGLAGFAVGVVLVVAWRLVNDVHVDFLGYTSRGAVLLTVGCVVGAYADRVQRDLRLRRRATHELELRADDLERSNADLRQAVTRLEAFADVARSVGGETELARVLDVIVDRALTVVDARVLLICLRDGDALRVAATSGPAGGRRLSAAAGPLATTLVSDTAIRIAARDGETIALAPGLETRAAVLAPLVFRGRRLGLLAALDHLGERPDFDAEDEELISTLAASAATAVATAQSVARERLRDSIEAAEQARGRWARELHDETLQGLVGLRMLLSSARRGRSSGETAAAIEQAADQTKREIVNLRALIAELRPAALDELGLGPAIETLARRSAAAAEADVSTRVVLEPARERLAPETESTVYRVVQEALTNVAKHAAADHVRVAVRRDNGAIDVTVEDDGHGFDPDCPTDGLGLVGMRERVELTGGRLEIRSRGEGTLVHARLPAAPVG